MMRTEEETKAYLQMLHVAQFGDNASGQAGKRDFPSVFASAPGRVELAGNHTDHQGGRTISAAIDQRTYALASLNDTDEIRVYMGSFVKCSVHLSDLEARMDERGDPISIIRGMAAAYVQSGKRLCGFDIVTCSDIPVGAGLSSSAAFEVLIGTAIRALCSPSASGIPDDSTTLALEGVWVENNYFGKLCGAQDQLASVFGGVIAMDFSSDEPLVTPIDFDAGACPYALFLIDSQYDHSHLAEEYAAIPIDMKAVAQYFGCTRLKDVPYRVFLRQLSQVRAKLGDRAVLRALHFFEETKRVRAQTEALLAGNYEAFIKKVRLSGASSAQFLQNVSPLIDESGISQPAMVILALCAHLLDSDSSKDRGRFSGAYRIHGGGFGGSVLAFVPKKESDFFKASMDALLGYDACMHVSMGSRGAHAERLD